MLRFLSKLVRKFQAANTARTPRRAPRRSMLRLEGLEDRMLLSAATATLTGSTPNVIVNQPFEQIAFSGDKRPGEVVVFLGKNTLGSIFRTTLSPLTDSCGMDSKHDLGNGTGTYTVFGIQFLHGPFHVLTGSGNFLGLKNATITGEVIPAGSGIFDVETGTFIHEVVPVGYLTFTNSRGSVTIDLTGLEQPGFSALCSTFRYTVVKGTGAYAGLRGSGLLTLNLGPESRAFNPSGQFTLTIDSFNKINQQGLGTYTHGLERDAGVQYKFTGAGQFFGLHDAEISGSLYSVGFIARGHAGGELTFTNAKGSVTIELVGPEQAGFAPLPGTFHYSVKKGTGAYAHLTGSGSLSLKLSPMNGQGMSGGEFTLTFDSFLGS
jgi:hypothetical protein